MTDFSIHHGTKSYLDPVSKCHVFWTGGTSDRYCRRFEPPTDNKARLELQIFFAKEEIKAAVAGFNNVKAAILSGRGPLAGWDYVEFDQPPEDRGDNYTPPGKVTLAHLQTIHAERVARLATLEAEYNSLPAVQAINRRREWAMAAEMEQSNVLGRLNDSLRHVTL